MRVTKDNLRSHVDQLIHKEQAALEHLLMDQHATDSLGGNHQEDTQQVRRKSWPGSIGYRHDRTVDKSIYFVRIMCRNMDIIAYLFDSDT